MNEILQKRIIEAARDYSDHNYIDEGVEVPAFLEGADFALKNQWISVEEGLPKEDIPNCFVAYKAMDMVLYSTGSYEKDNDEWYVDGVGFNAEVTHWMYIPQLKGNVE